MSAADGEFNAMLIKDFRDAHQGAVIDAQGREIPITAKMIERACEKLERMSSANRSSTDHSR